MSENLPATKADEIAVPIIDANATQQLGSGVDSAAKVPEERAVAEEAVEGSPAGNTPTPTAAAAATNGTSESVAPTNRSSVDATTTTSTSTTTLEAKTEIPSVTNADTKSKNVSELGVDNSSHSKNNNTNPSKKTTTKQSSNAVVGTSTSGNNDKPDAGETTIANPSSSSSTTTSAAATSTATIPLSQQHPSNAKQLQQPTPSSTQAAASKPTLFAPPPQALSSGAAPQPTSNHIMDNFDDDDYSDSNDTLLTMSFNQDGGCLAIGTGSGFRICNVHPYQETFRRYLGGGGGGGDGSHAIEGGTFRRRYHSPSADLANVPLPHFGIIVSSFLTPPFSPSLSILAGIAHIEMLYRTNLLALTGHSNSPMYPPNKVFVYDDHLQRPIGELSFRQKVLTTKLRRDRIVIVLRDRVYIYNFSDLVSVYNCEARCTNKYGATSSNPLCHSSLLACRLY
jgi:hypothetical protein